MRTINIQPSTLNPFRMSLLTSAATAVLASACLIGCARFRSTVTERTGKDGVTERETRVSAGTFFDSKSELTKLNSGQTDKSQKVSIG